MTGQVAVKMERNGWIWDIFQKFDVEGLAGGVHIGSVGRRKVKNNYVFKLQQLGALV